MKFLMMTIFLLTSTAFAGNTVEVSRNQFSGRMFTSHENFKYYTEATSLSLITDRYEKLAIRTSLGFADDFSTKLFKSEGFLRTNIQYSILTLGDEKAPRGERLYLVTGFSAHRLWTTAGRLDRVNALSGLGFEHYSESFGWYIGVLQNISRAVNNIDGYKINGFSYIDLSFGINYKL